MPFVRSIDNLPTGTTLESLSGASCAACEQQGAVVNYVPKAEYPNYNPNDTLAQIIVDAWRDPAFKDQLLNNSDTTLRGRGLFLLNPRVMTHTEFKNEVVLEKDMEERAILVLPDPPLPLPPAGTDLLDSARAAMAYTPVGI
jgi:hypothetical protein